MKGHQADHPIATVCRVLGVSPSGYYAWHQRAPSTRAQRDAELTMQLHTIHLESRGTYGAPRVHAELAAQGIHVGRKRVARLMRAAGVRGVSRRKWVTTTTRDPEARAAPDLVQRDFHVDGPDRLWVAIVVGVADRPHRRPDAERQAALPVGDGRVLTPMIRMMDDAVGAALLQGHVQRGQHQLGPQVRGHRPTDHAPAPRIQHRTLLLEKV